MKKLVVALAALGMFISMASADTFRLAEFNRSSLFSDVSFGAAYYEDKYDTDWAGYVQIPAAYLFDDNLFIGFGVTVPSEHLERTRPHFSLGTSLDRFLHKGIWLNPQIGAYIMASPYTAWGFQLGIEF